MQLSSYIISVICILVGLVTLIYLGWSWIRQRDSRQWQSTTGKILESDVSAQSDGWCPRVSYSYTVSGQSYTNDRISLYPSNDTDKPRAMKQIAPYPVGKNVRVYYAPNSPKDSALDTQPSLWRSLFLIAFAAFFFAAAMAIFRDPSILN
jgi:Protein of unknown function (DUF3592)